MSMVFYAFDKAPEDVVKSVTGMNVKDVAWVVLIPRDELDSWCSFQANGKGELASLLRPEVSLNYIFRDNKPVIVFFAEPKQDESLYTFAE